MSTEPLTLTPPVSAAAATPRYPWLFSARLDLAVFLGSALLSLALLAVGARLGVLRGSTPDWAWVPAVLLIDVAHVWATIFRVYLDPVELRRRPVLYTLVPLLSWLLGVLLFVFGEWLTGDGAAVFWRTLAYLAVFHFVRQQYGWVALYRARAGERGGLGRWIDTAAIYLATIYPLIYWHAHLPRKFDWFYPDDFTALPTLLDRIAAPLYWTALAAYALRALYLWLVQRTPNPGKDVVVATTAVCWYVGIVAFNSDYAFTVTNVVIHGVPYLALVFWYWHGRRPRALAGWSRTRMLTLFLATVWLLAYVEELLWDRGVWHKRAWLFGEAWNAGEIQMLLVPLLALPQAAHYVLDGFIWKRRSNPRFALIDRN